MTDEDRLLVAARKLESRALAEIHDRFYPDLYRYLVYRTGDEHTADDLSSEVFMRLLEALQSGKGPDVLRPWLFGVAGHLVADHFRRAARRPQVELSEDLSSPDGDPAKEAGVNLRIGAVRLALQQLTDDFSGQPGGRERHYPLEWVYGERAGRRVLECVGLPDPALHYVMDWEYWIRLGLALAPDRVCVIYEPLSVVRTWPGTKTLTGIEAICDEHRQVLAKLFAGGALPSHLQLLKDESLAGTYIKQSYLQWQAGRGADARRSLAQARALGPASKGSRLRGAWLWARTLLPYWVYDSWQKRGRR